MLNPSLKVIYNEVIQGYSKTIFEDSPVYIKHFGALDTYEINLYELKCTEEARKRGVLTLEERQQEMILSGEWTKDNEIAQVKFEITNTEKGKALLKNYGMIKQADRGIQLARERLEKLLKEKNEVIGPHVAEIIISNKVNQKYLYTSCFKDKELTTPRFEEEEFLNLDDSQMNGLVEAFNDAIKKVNSSNLKKIAVDNNVRGTMVLCDNNIYYLMGRPIQSLSYYQIELFGIIKQFNGIFANCESEVPQEILDNPDELVSWYQASKNVASEPQIKDSAPKVGQGMRVNLDDIDHSNLKPGQTLNVKDMITQRHPNVKF